MRPNLINFNDDQIIDLVDENKRIMLELEIIKDMLVSVMSFLEDE